MWRLLADENFNSDIVRGLLLTQPKLDIVRVQDVGLAAQDDPTVLAWAAENSRILLTHDRATMPDFAYDRVVEGKLMPGIFVFSDRFPVGQAIQEILFAMGCSEQSEWAGLVVNFPI